MKIAHIAPVNFNIPNGKGGPEIAAYNLQLALRGLGIDSVFFAAKNTKIPGPLRYFFPKELNSSKEFLQSSKMQRAQMIMAHYAWAYNQAHEFDIVQSHVAEWSLLFAASHPEVVSVIKVSTTPSPYLQKMIARISHPNMHYILLTKAEARYFPQSVKNFTVIPESTEVQDTTNVKKEDWFLFVGRLVKEKHPEMAIEACLKAKKKIVVIGAPIAHHDEKNHKQYLAKLAPLLKKKNVTYIREVPHKKIFAYYKKAQALIFPTEAHYEAMGMAFIEAQASGTPVISLRNPLSKELVVHGKTGLLASDKNNLVRMLDRVGEIEPRDCKEFVEKNFSHEAVGLRYKKLYESLLAKSGRSK